MCPLCLLISPPRRREVERAPAASSRGREGGAGVEEPLETSRPAVTRHLCRVMQGRAALQVARTHVSLQREEQIKGPEAPRRRRRHERRGPIVLAHLFEPHPLQHSTVLLSLLI